MSIPRVLTVPIRLSQTRPDFEALVMQLQIWLSQKATWIDLLTSSTGQTLIEQMAAVGTFNQFAIESAAREAFLDTAVRDSSIYAITRMLGVRITRKSPASADVVFTRTSDLTTSSVLGRFTEFDLDGRKFFNRVPVIFQKDSADSDPVKLYEGKITRQTFPANSQMFREIYLGEPGFVVSNEDLDVFITNPSSGLRELWLATLDGVWTAAAEDKVYYDTTSGLGDTILAFGDGYHGALPSVGYNIEVVYAVTMGSAGNVGTAGLIAVPLGLLDIKGVTTSSVTAGADEKVSSYYKSVAPNLYKARTRAVTAPDYKAIASSYPGVASISIQAQRNIAPHDLRWMNVVRVCILPEYADQYTVSAWSTFLTWFTRKQHAAVQVQKFNPIKLFADVTFTLAMTPASVAATVLIEAESNVRALFAKDLATLGKRIAVSDIVDACIHVVGVDYVTMVAPLSDFICPTVNHYYELRDLKLSTTYSERTFYNVHQFVAREQ